MRKTGKSSRPQLVLPSGMDPADLLSSLPADLVDHLKNTCDILVSNPKEGDPRIATALDGLGEGVAVVVDNGEIGDFDELRLYFFKRYMKIVTDANAAFNIDGWEEVWEYEKKGCR